MTGKQEVFPGLEALEEAETPPLLEQGAEQWNGTESLHLLHPSLRWVLAGASFSQTQ